MELKKAYRDLIAMLALLLASVLLQFVLIPAQIPLRGGWAGADSFTSRTFPSILAGVLAVSSLSGLIGAGRRIFLLRKAGQTDTAARAWDLAGLVRPAVMFAVVAVYGYLFTKLGYIPATLLACPVILGILGCRKWQYYLCVYAFAAAVYLVFKLVLQVPLP